MSRLTLDDLQSDFFGVIEHTYASKERTLVSKEGQDVAAIVPIEDLKLLERLLEEEEDRQDIAAAEIALADARIHGTRSMEDVFRELDD